MNVSGGQYIASDKISRSMVRTLHDSLANVSEYILTVRVAPKTQYTSV